MIFNIYWIVWKPALAFPKKKLACFWDTMIIMNSREERILDFISSHIYQSSIPLKYWWSFTGCSVRNPDQDHFQISALLSFCSVDIRWGLATSTDTLAGRVGAKRGHEEHSKKSKKVESTHTWAMKKATGCLEYIGEYIWLHYPVMWRLLNKTMKL